MKEEQLKVCNNALPEKNEMKEQVREPAQSIWIWTEESMIGITDISTYLLLCHKNI